LYPNFNSFVVSFVVYIVVMDPLIVTPTMTFGFSSMSPALDHDLSLHLTNEMTIAPWDSAFFFLCQVTVWGPSFATLF
jgi:hypothetical protein